MDHIWDKLDGYTKSDYLYSSDDENHEVYIRKTEHLYISTKEFHQTEVDDESLCSEDVNSLEVEDKKETKSDIYKDLLDEMKKSELHSSSERRNVQEKIDEMSAEKSQQKEELNEMQHKAQVISKSARMSATDVLSSIVSSETINNEESGEMDEYYERIRSTNTNEDTPGDLCENERKSSSSDVDLPNIPPLSQTLNTVVMKSKANVARQGSMKARRKPTTVKRKSWTPGMDEFNIREEGEMTVDDMPENEQGENWVMEAENGDLPRTGSVTPSDSSSEDEKEVVKPHLRSGVALPGLRDALKIQMTRSELKRPTASNLVKTAKDAKDNEVTKGDQLETLPSKPAWMKEVEERKKKPRAPQRRHKTLPARCSELDTLFEQRKQLQSNEALAPESSTHEGAVVAREDTKCTRVSGEDIDPELQKMFERRKNLKPLEVDNDTGGDGVLVKGERPKSFHSGQIDPELSKMFDRRKNLKLLEMDTNTSVEGGVMKEPERPKTFYGDQADSELNKMFERRKNLQPIEGRVFNRDDREQDQVFKPRNVHLENNQATELDKIFEKRKQLRPVEAARSPSHQGRFHDPSPVVNPRSPPADPRQTSGIVRARFHDTKLEPLRSKAEVKVATVTEVQVRTARQESIRPEAETERNTAVGHLPLGNQSGNSRPPHPPTAPVQGNRRQAGEFDSRGTSHASAQMPVDRNRRSNGSLNATGQNDRHLPSQGTGGAQVAQFVFDTSAAASHTTVGRIPLGGNQTSVGSTAQNHAERKASPMPAKLDSRSDHVIGAREDHVVLREDHVIATRGSVLESHHVSTKHAAISSTSSKSGTSSFLEQLSGRPGSGKSQSVCQGKSVSKPDVEARGYPMKHKPTAVKTEQDWQTPCTDRKPTIPSRSRHSDVQHHSHGGEPINHSQSIPFSHPEGFSPGTLPPIDARYLTDPSSLNSGHRPLPRSMSHPPNSISQFPNHPSLSSKMSDPQFSHSPPTVHSPSAPKKGRVTSPRSVRLREVKSPVREVKSELSGGSQMVYTAAMLEDSRRLHKVTSRVEMLGNSASANEAEIRRTRAVDSRAGNGRVSNDLRSEAKEDASVRSRNVQLSTNVSRYSDSFITFSDSLNDKDKGRGLTFVRSSDWSLDERIKRAQSPDRSEDQKTKERRNPNRLSDQSLDKSDNQRISRLQSPDRVQSYEGFGDQRIKGYYNPGKLRDQGINRVQSPDRSDDQRTKRVQNPETLRYQWTKKVENVDKSGNQMINRSRSPDRSSDHSRITRSRSPNRSSDQKIDRPQNPYRSNDHKTNNGPSPDRSVSARMKDVHGSRVRVQGSNELSESYQNSADNERRVMENSMSANELCFRQYEERAEAFTNGIHDDKLVENKPRGVVDNIFNRETVERPKPVTVTVKSLSKSTVYGESPMVERTRSHDRRDNMVYSNGECGINGVVNGEVGRRGVKAVTPQRSLDIQSSESTAIPKWKQELQEKKRLQKAKQGESSRHKGEIKPEQSGNDMAEWQKRVQGIRKTWGTGDSEDSAGTKDGEKNLQGNHVTHPDANDQNDVPGFLNEFHQKKTKKNVEGDSQDNETFV